MLERRQRKGEERVARWVIAFPALAIFGGSDGRARGLDGATKHATHAGTFSCEPFDTRWRALSSCDRTQRLSLAIPGDADVACRADAFEHLELPHKLVVQNLRG